LAPAALGKEIFIQLLETYRTFVVDILGLVEEKGDVQEGLLNLLLNQYTEAKTARNYTKVDEIRSGLKAMGILVKDMKDRIDWAYEE
jgi:cysteinyl-tRNA synthetase